VTDVVKTPTFPTRDDENDSIDVTSRFAACEMEPEGPPEAPVPEADVRWGRL
jgi:hypothetical protein